MNIELMTYTGPNNRINKIPTLGTTVSGTLLENTSVTDPTITFEFDAFPNYNYIHIPDFNRYYYIRDVVNISDKLWQLTLHVDVLKSFQNGIMSSPCIIAKTASNDFNLYLPDPNFKCQQNARYGMVNFPSGFDADNAYFYLTLFG